MGQLPGITITDEELHEGLNVVDLLVKTPLFESKSDVRRVIKQRGAYLNDTVIESIDHIVTAADLANVVSLVVRKGKKNHCVVWVVPESLENCCIVQVV